MTEAAMRYVLVAVLLLFVPIRSGDAQERQIRSRSRCHLPEQVWRL
jgi:hypothetical protein